MQQPAYEKLKRLIRKQLEPLGLRTGLTAYFNLKLDELHELNQPLNEERQLTDDVNLNVQQHSEETNRDVARIDQNVARMVENSLF